jgi:hypothetical protein
VKKCLDPTDEFSPRLDGHRYLPLVASVVRKFAFDSRSEKCDEYFAVAQAALHRRLIKAAVWREPELDEDELSNHLRQEIVKFWQKDKCVYTPRETRRQRIKNDEPFDELKKVSIPLDETETGNLYWRDPNSLETFYESPDRVQPPHNQASVDETMELLESFCRNDLDRQILRMRADGYWGNLIPRTEIARQLGVSPDKVDRCVNHLRRSYRDWLNRN